MRIICSISSLWGVKILFIESDLLVFDHTFNRWPFHLALFVDIPWSSQQDTYAEKVWGQKPKKKREKK